MSELNPSLLLRGARAAARRHTPMALLEWREDIAQDIAEHALRSRARTEVVGPFIFRWAALHAIRRLLFLLRYQVELPADFDAPCDAPDELGAIALWRLQVVWDDLTDIERLALGQLLSGDSPTALARGAGIEPSTIHRARATALARLDNPGAFSRGRERQRVDMSACRAPAVHSKVAARQARDAEQARQRRLRVRLRYAVNPHGSAP